VSEDPTPTARPVPTGATLRLPAVLADLAGGRRALTVAPAPPTVAALLDALATDQPLVVRRIRDETGALRRFVNLYVDGEDVRHLDGLATPLADGATVHVLPSVAGG
jgi:molybdopterin converting factor small subunit